VGVDAEGFVAAAIAQELGAAVELREAWRKGWPGWVEIRVALVHPEESVVDGAYNHASLRWLVLPGRARVASRRESAKGRRCSSSF
jgi:hypothetical protein